MWILQQLLCWGGEGLSSSWTSRPVPTYMLPIMPLKMIENSWLISSQLTYNQVKQHVNRFS